MRVVKIFLIFLIFLSYLMRRQMKKRRGDIWKSCSFFIRKLLPCLSNAVTFAFFTSSIWMISVFFTARSSGVLPSMLAISRGVLLARRILTIHG